MEQLNPINCTNSTSSKTSRRHAKAIYKETPRVYHESESKIHTQ